MATNDILTFAGSSTNILTQAEYAADAQRDSGNVPGVARSKLVNKAARQSAFVSSMIGQFIANIGNINVVDDNDVPGLLADFVASMTAYLQTRVATTAQAQALTDDSVLLTPKKLADAFKGSNQSLSAIGYQKLPGGLILQWGGVSSGSGAAAIFTYPIAFPNAMVLRGAFFNDVGGASPPGGFVSVADTGNTKVNMAVNAWYATNTRAPNGLSLWCIAIGY